MTDNASAQIAAPWNFAAPGEDDLAADNREQQRVHVLSRIRAQPVGEHPFHHLFIEDVLPADLYAAIREHMMECKYGDKVQDRLQDNTAFVNKRYNLFDVDHPVAHSIRAIFSDPEIKLALLEKFFVHPSRELADSLAIHREFEYFFTEAGRFQNIHVDIPPKFVSFVFYIPEHPVPPEEEERNATVLYDKNLAPCYPARFKANSVCIFAPHYYTYHGFSSTIDRDVLVLFYVSQAELETWWKLHDYKEEGSPFAGLLNAIEGKLRAHPLIEYGLSENRLLSERAGCLVNAPNGRVMRDS